MATCCAAAGAAERLSELLAEQPGIAAPANPVALPEPRARRDPLRSCRVPLSDAARTCRRWHDFSLDVAPGETVAVVGPSGAGKTTLFQLIQRFYDPRAAARSAIDGVALPAGRPRRDPPPYRDGAAGNGDLRRVGARQYPLRRMGARATTAIWAAAEAANAAEFLRKLPDGLDTFMGEGGARLSGGQRQRIAIARALLRDAPILLLDEATSALDAESERLVQQALERLMDGRTTLVIAHRLATVRAARADHRDGRRPHRRGRHARER